MLRRIYCYVLTQRVIGNWDAHSQGSVKHQLPIVAVIASGQLLQGVYLRTIVIRGEIPWSGVMHLWCWKGGRFANKSLGTRFRPPGSLLCVAAREASPNTISACGIRVRIADISGIIVCIIYCVF